MTGEQLPDCGEPGDGEPGDELLPLTDDGDGDVGHHLLGVDEPSMRLHRVSGDGEKFCDGGPDS